MRPLFLLFPITLISLTSNALAQRAPYPKLNEAPNSTVHVVAAPKTVHLRREEARQIAGGYEMENGWHLRVRPNARSIEATIDKQTPMQLLAVGSGKFVSADGNVTIEFNLGSSGEDVLISYVPGPNLAELVVPVPLSKR